MVKKAATLMALSELDLDQDACTFIVRNLRSIDDVVLFGRTSAYWAAVKAGHYRITKWQQELIDALDAAGFIRRDFDQRSLCVNGLYNAVLLDESIATVSDFNHITNEQYEAFRPITDEQVESIKLMLEAVLTDREYQAITLRYGIATGERVIYDYIGERFGVSRERVRQIETVALCKIRRFNALPSTEFWKNRDYEMLVLDQYNSSGKQGDYVGSMERSIAFAQWLREAVASAQVQAAGSNSYQDVDDPTAIEQLNLCTRAYNCLKRSGFATVSDILHYPRCNFTKIANLGEVSRRDIQAKMQHAGYTDFSLE